MIKSKSLRKCIIGILVIYYQKEEKKEEKETVENGVAKFAKEIEAEEKQVEVEKIANLKKAKKP